MRGRVREREKERKKEKNMIHGWKKELVDLVPRILKVYDFQSRVSTAVRFATGSQILHHISRHALD